MTSPYPGDVPGNAQGECYKPIREAPRGTANVTNEVQIETMSSADVSVALFQWLERRGRVPHRRDTVGVHWEMSTDENGVTVAIVEMGAPISGASKVTL